MNGRKPAKNYTRNFLDAGASQANIVMHPIGIVRSPFQERFQAPHQGVLGKNETGRIELHHGMNLEQALTDLDGFSHIWVIYWMHLNRGWNPLVRPPRDPKRRTRGLFATRAPHRPNSIGLTAVSLLGIDGRTLIIANHDMLDGTPVLDIKPYLPYSDALPNASSGWVSELSQSDL